MQKWHPIDEDTLSYVGIVEFKDNKEESHVFAVLKNDDYLVFGAATNIGLIQSGYMEKDNAFSLDENLQELVSDLETYYNDGPEYVNGIVCNERM